MFESKYSKVLTVILVIVIIAILGLLGFLGYDLYQRYFLENDALAFVEDYEKNIDNNKEDEEPENKNEIGQLRRSRKSNRRYKLNRNRYKQ